MSDIRKQMGDKRKKERQKADLILAGLRGKSLDKLTNKETTDLLQVICLKLQITDKDRIIQ